MKNNDRTNALIQFRSELNVELCLFNSILPLLTPSLCLNTVTADKAALALRLQVGETQLSQTDMQSLVCGYFERWE